MMSRRPPQTSFGYLAPPEAEVVGWRCHAEDCGRTELEAPAQWPRACPGCGHLVDPVFAEPWAHFAKGYELRARVKSPRDRLDRQSAVVDLVVWRYKGALLKHDRAEAETARADLRRVAAELRAEHGDWWVAQAWSRVIALAIEAGDLTTAAEEILAFHEAVRAITPRDLNDNQPRTDTRTFVDISLTFLCHPGSVGHPLEHDVVDAMVGVHDMLRACQYSSGTLDDRRHEALRLREAIRGAAQPASPQWIPPAEVSAPAAGRRLPSAARRRIRAGAAVVAAAKDGTRPELLVHTLDDMAQLVAASGGVDARAGAAGVLADAALVVAEIHDDPGPLRAAADRLAPSSALAHLLRARADIVDGDNAAAATEIDAGLSAPDGERLGLLPHLHALRGWTIMRLDPARLDAGIAACREGRVSGRTKTTPADLPLARMLVEKALHQETPADEAVHLLREVLTLCRRSGADARVVAQEAKSALAVLTGRGDVDKRARSWRAALHDAENDPIAAQMRLATAWVRWALGTNDIDFAAEAYHHLVSLIPSAVRVRYRSDARSRVLAAVREHTEEAGYWLARARRYRDAVVALETGRAVVLSTLIERDDPAVAQALLDAGRGDLLDRYRETMTGVDAAERGRGDSHRAWALFRGVAREVADVIGADPVEPTVEYADVTNAIGDDVVVYVAAAGACGYALVVAGRYDPQCVWLPDLNRGAIEEWLDDHSGAAEKRLRGMADDLHWLWTHGMKDVLVYAAGAPIVTLIPVGVMTLLPLHATPSYAGHYAPIRYAPNVRTLRWCAARNSAYRAAAARVLVADVPRAPDQEVLENAAAEGAAVASVWPGQCTRLPDATWARFEPEAHDCDVWHIVCHGGIESREILQSRLAFADRSVTIGHLRERFHFAPRRLAIVAACDMHLSATDLPNESIGLPLALLQLGFVGVIAASWVVNDLATSYLMVRFHREWRRSGAHPAVALTIAQRWLRQAGVDDLVALAPGLQRPAAKLGPRPFADPLYWAAFAYTGG